MSAAACQYQRLLVQPRRHRYGADVGHQPRSGSALRDARRHLGIPIEQAAADAGVPLRYARLLEGEVTTGGGISDELYLIPFFRRYASALGLNAEEMLPDFIGELHEIAGPAGPPARPAYRSPIVALWKPTAIAVSVGMAVLLLMRQAPDRPTFEDDQWANAEGSRVADGTAGAEAQPPAAPPSPVSGATMEPAPAAAAAASGNGSGEQGGSVEVERVRAAAEPSAVPVPSHAGTGTAGTHELRMVAAEETWLEIAVDDEPKTSHLLEPGESRSWNARAAFTLTLGNAGGVTIALDGRELPKPGRSGEVVRNLRLPPAEAHPAHEG